MDTRRNVVRNRTGPMAAPGRKWSFYESLAVMVALITGVTALLSSRERRRIMEV